MLILFCLLMWPGSSPTASIDLQMYDGCVVWWLQVGKLSNPNLVRGCYAFWAIRELHKGICLKRFFFGQNQFKLKLFEMLTQKILFNRHRVAGRVLGL